MYLKALELHGFKSFPDKTVLHFNPGSTVIVGPNGSGKSNITDAVRWVLGELSTKNIRGSKMEDVIFVGADGHRPMSFAEVSITFDDSDEPKKLNCPYDEVTVTRRYYRAGESEYFINRKPCRLKDINELFMNTGIGREGYSIIGQGKIAEIISKKSDDRRGIFEETAGITKYRYKKNEAQKKLSETDDNMTRVLDIFSEIASRVGPLEKEAAKARRYLELYEEKKRLDISILLHDIDKLRVDVDKLTSQCRLSAHELEMAEDSEAQLEAKYERIFEASQENKQAGSRLYEEIRRITEQIHEAENNCSRLLGDISNAQTRIDAAQEAAKKSLEAENREREYASGQSARLEENAKETETLKKKAQELEEEKEEVRCRISACDGELEEALKVRREYEAALNDLNVRLSVLKTNISDRGAREAAVKADVAKYEEKLKQINAEAEESRQSAQQYEEALKKADEAVAQCDKELLRLSDKTEELSKRRSAYVASSDALESRISALKRMMEHFDGFNNSVRFVMKSSAEGKLSGIHGPVSSIIRVEEEYIVAMETAFGASLQNIVVDDEASAKAAIRALKEAGAGRATFYPITSVSGQERTAELREAARMPGFAGYADELVSCDEEYKKIISSIVGRIAVFDNIDNASEVARRCKWMLRAVTLDGQQINMGGSFTGGSVKRDSGMLTRGAHIERLEAEKRELDAKISETSAELKKYEDKAAELSNYRRREDEKAKLSAVMLRSERAQLDEHEANISVCENLLEQLRHDARKLLEFGVRGGEDAAALEREIAETEKTLEGISAERNEISVRRGAEEDSLALLGEKSAEMQIKLAELVRDAANLSEAIAESRAREEKQKAETQAQKELVRSLELASENTEKLIEKQKEQANELRQTLSDSENKRAELESTGMQYDKRLNEIRLEIKDVSAKKELYFRAHTANESKLERLNSEVDKMTGRLWDEYELTHTAACALDYPAVSDKERPAVNARLGELKSAVKSLGSVNVGAIEEYAQLKERYDYLNGQITDLGESKKELEKIIASVEEEMKRMFAETFEKINVYFGETFKELFGGGSAHLTLTDPDNLLTSGIEINAAPPGKMIKNLGLLSGGEQAFVAIALIFALIRVNPSPFCIFDEIEAALDEVNVTRVANYVKRFSAELQIILITHRRGMMETADTLYGVTMPRRGISKVFMLDVTAVSRGTQQVDELVREESAPTAKK